MNDEGLVCEVGWESIRFHYAHHGESSWEVRLVDGALVDVRGYPITGVERPLTEEETDALLEAHLATMFRPREFEIDRSGDVVAVVAWLALGFAFGAFVFSLL